MHNPSTTRQLTLSSHSKKLPLPAFSYSQPERYTCKQAAPALLHYVSSNFSPEFFIPFTVLKNGNSWYKATRRYKNSAQIVNCYCLTVFTSFLITKTPLCLQPKGRKATFLSQTSCGRSGLRDQQEECPLYLIFN